MSEDTNRRVQRAANVFLAAEGHLSIPKAMDGAGFSASDCSNRTLQMRVRRLVTRRKASPNTPASASLPCNIEVKASGGTDSVSALGTDKRKRVGTAAAANIEHMSPGTVESIEKAIRDHFTKEAANRSG